MHVGRLSQKENTHTFLERNMIIIIDDDLRKVVAPTVAIKMFRQNRTFVVNKNPFEHIEFWDKVDVFTTYDKRLQRFDNIYWWHMLFL